MGVAPGDTAREKPPRRVAARRAWAPPERLWLVCAAAVLVVAAADWATPAGVVVGIFLCIPIVLASFSDAPGRVWSIAALAVVSFGVAAVMGRGPISPAAVWVPNRIFVLLTLGASTALSLLLQRARIATEQARDEALSARDLNELLMSLLAHDLRTPLSLAAQGLQYVEGAASRGDEIDHTLIRDLQARLRRSLRAVETVLSVARKNTESRNGPAPAIADELQEEVAAFRREAEAAGKELLVRADGLHPGTSRVNRLVLRQVLAILLDNAIRYAVPGLVSVEASVEERRLVVRVRDRGPGFAATRARDGGLHEGSGMGLELARSLAIRAGGVLEVEQDTPAGSCVAMRLPMAGVAVATDR